MKKLVVLLVMATAFISCNQLADNEYVIKGTVEGIENGKMAVLETQDETGMGLKAIDSAVVTDGKFEFKGTTTEPELRFIQLPDVQGKAVFILENGEINLKIYKDSVNKSEVGGTYNNDEFTKYNKGQSAIQKKIADFRNENMQKMQEAMQAEDTATVNTIQADFVKLQDDLNAYNVKFAEDNPKAFISVLMLENMFYQPNVDIEKIRKVYTGLDKTIQDTKPGKKIGEMVTNYRVITF